MRILALESAPYTEDGHIVKRTEAGEEYDISEYCARLMFANKTAKLIKGFNNE